MTESNERMELFAVYYTDQEKLEIILDNILIMMSNRVFIDGENTKPLINLSQARKEVKNAGESTWTVRADNGVMYAIKVVFQKVTTIGKQSPISDFARDYDNSYRKIVVSSDYNKKIIDWAKSNNAQIFKESALMMDIIKYIDQPEFKVLSPNEAKQYMDEYNVTEYMIKKINNQDPIYKYYDLKKGDVLRIKRPSPASGEANDYRMAKN